MPLTDRDYDLISLYIDDTLTPPERRAVESRLATDAEFKAEHDAIKQTVALVKSMPEMIAPRDLRLTSKMASDMLAELRTARPVQRARTPTFRVLYNLAAAAASLVLVLAGTLTLLRPTMTQQPQTVAVASISETPVVLEEAAEGTATEATDQGTSLGMLVPPAATMLPYLIETTPTLPTGGFGGGVVDPEENTTMMQAAAPTMTDADFFDAAPAPVTVPSQPTTDESAERSMAAPTGTPAPFATPTQAPTATFEAAGMSVMEAAPTQSAPDAAGESEGDDLTVTGSDAANEPTNEQDPQEAPGAAPSDVARTEKTSVADTADGAIAQEEGRDRGDDQSQDDVTAQDGRVAAPRAQDGVPSTLVGFALVIAGLVLGGATLILRNRRP